MRQSTCRPLVLIVLAAFGALLSVLAGEAFGRDHRELVPDYQPLRRVVKPVDVRIAPDAPPGHVVVKFRRTAVVASPQSRPGGSDAATVRSLIRDADLPALQPLIADDPAVIRARRMAAEDRARMNLPDLALYFRTPVANPQATENLIRQLNALAEVEIAFYQPRPEPAVRRTAPALVRSATAPFNWQDQQHYLDPAPDGVDAYAAWTLPGGTGAGIRIIDVEYGWTLGHEDLSKGATALQIGDPGQAYHDHGTAVLGEMVADRNGFGMTGIVYDATIGVSASPTAEALYLSTAALDPGDLILIERHAPGPRYNFQGRDDQLGYIAMEYWQDIFDACLFAYASGMIVCEAAGNGSEDFDDPIYDSLFTREFRDSHAIICGAGAPPYVGGGGIGQDRSKLDFSNYGSRVDMQGYGQGVYTLGYGDLYDGGPQATWYTGTFSGTSSASPIVTGAIAALSGVYKAMLGRTLDADTARDLLVATGSPQEQPYLSFHIGPRPNLYPVLDGLFDPVDSIWYDDIPLGVAASAALPIRMSNSHPVSEITLPFRLTGPATIFIDSLTRGPRTAGFTSVELAFDNRFFGEIAFRLRTDPGEPLLPAGSGVIGYLWVRSTAAAQSGQVEAVDSAWLGSTSYLQLRSYFDDGYPDYFASGAITIVSCDCPYQGDIDASGQVDAIDLGTLIDIVFFSSPDTGDPACPKTRSDLDCSGSSDAIDLGLIVDYVFFAGSPPCDPCN